MTDKPWDARAAAWLITPFIHSEKVHPNHFTTLRLCVGISGSVVFALGTSANLAACLIVLSNFLDHTDGELARASGKTSRFGHNYDLASDAIVTIAMFSGIGIGLAHHLGLFAAIAGSFAGAAVAIIFHLRNKLESAQGKDATKQPAIGGFEAEDILHLMPLVTFFNGLEWFLWAAAIGAPIAALIVMFDYRRKMQA